MLNLAGFRYSFALTVLVTLPVAGVAADRWTQYTNFTAPAALADGGRHIWIGTQGGLIRMDKATGAREYFNQANSSLTDSRILVLDCHADGRLAAISQSGALVEFDGSTWSNPGAAGPFQGQRLVDLGWDPEGGLYVLAFEAATRQPSVFHRREGRWNRFPLIGATALASGLYTYGYDMYGPYGTIAPYLQVDGQGRAWVATGSGSSRPKLFRLSSDGAVDTMAIPLHLNPRLYVQPKSGTPYWICARVLAKPVSDGWDTIPFPPDVIPQLRAHPRHLFALAPDGTEYWAFDGLLRRRGGTLSAATLPGGFSGYTPLLLLAPGSGTAAPAASPGLYAARGDVFATLTGDAWSTVDFSRKPLTGGTFHSLLPSGPGSDGMLLGQAYGLQAFDPIASKSVAVDFGPAWVNSGTAFYALGEAPDGRTWLLRREGLVRLAPGGAETLTPPDAPWTPPVYTYPGSGTYLATDAAGTFWVAGTGRLLAIPGGTPDTRAWRSHWLPAPWRNGADITAMSVHPDGSIWFTTAPRTLPETQLAGLVGRYDGRTWTLFDASHHPWIGSTGPAAIRCDVAGNVWVRHPNGLLQWDGAAWREHARSASPHFPNGIRALAVAPDGRLWVATAMPDAQLARWAGSWEPIPGTRAVMGTTQVQSMTFDRAGKLWMATLTDGLLVYDPDGGMPVRIRSEGPAPRSSTRAALVLRADGSWGQGPGSGAPALRRDLRDLRGRRVGGASLRP